MDADRRPSVQSGAACKAALAALAERALDASVGLPTRVADHLRDCPACRTRLGRLATAVLDGGDDAITCAECQAWLPQYVGSDANARAEASPLLLVSGHLSTCRDCAEEEAWLAGALELMAAGVSSEHASAPVFDLTFLESVRQVKEPARRLVAFSAVSRRASSAAAGAWARLAASVAAIRRWAERRAGEAGADGKLAQARSVGLLVPVVVLLAVALGVLWATMKAIPAVPDLVTARQTAAAQRAGTATAQSKASATADANQTGTAVVPETTSGLSTGAGRTGTIVAASATASVTATEGSTPTARNPDESPDEERPDDTARPPAPSATVNPRTPTPGNPSETAYPPGGPWPSDIPPTGYPPPATGSPDAVTPGSSETPSTSTPSTPRPVTPSPSAPPSA